MSALGLWEARVYVGARIEGSVCGYAGLMITGDDAQVTAIAVDPLWHRNKIATRLLLHLAREAVHRHARNLPLEVRVSTQAAQELYRVFGFRPAGIRKGYYVET